MPVAIGVLYDFPQHDGGAAFETALRAGLRFTHTDDEVVLRPLQVVGLPSGSGQAVVDGFAELAATDVLAVVGPSISDNGVVVRDLADAAELACINYTGGEITRSRWMFHYQVGSLEEEPILLAQTIAEHGPGSVGLVYDASIVGHRYAEWFRSATANAIAAEVAVDPGAEDLAEQLTDVVRCDVICYLGLGVAARAVALALAAADCTAPVFANSALMFGYVRKDWRAGWTGWTYVDTVADDNPQRQALRDGDARTAAGPVGVAAYDIGRMLGVALRRAEPDRLSRPGLRDTLEQVKRMPATSGHPGTTMGFGVYDHAALKGDYLVLRQWRDGRSVQL